MLHMYPYRPEAVASRLRVTHKERCIQLTNHIQGDVHTEWYSVHYYRMPFCGMHDKNVANQGAVWWSTSARSWAYAMKW